MTTEMRRRNSSTLLSHPRQPNKAPENQTHLLPRGPIPASVIAVPRWRTARGEAGITEGQPQELDCGFLQVRVIFLLLNHPVWGDAGPAVGGSLSAFLARSPGHAPLQLICGLPWTVKRSLKTSWFLLKTPLLHQPTSKGEGKG